MPQVGDQFLGPTDQIVGPTDQILGPWIDAVFDAGDYTAGASQTWTVAEGDVIINRYLMIGPDTMLWQFNIADTTVGGTPDPELRITLPNGRTSAATPAAVAALQIDNAAQGMARAVVNAAATFMILFVADGTDWAASTALTNVAGQVIVELAPV